MASTGRSRAGCDACRRRKKKCDESRPQCSACARLGIPCEITRPKFKFVGDTFDNGQRRASIRASRQSQFPTRRHKKANDRGIDSHNLIPSSTFVREDGDYATDCEMLHANDSSVVHAAGRTAKPTSQFEAESIPSALQAPITYSSRPRTPDSQAPRRDLSVVPSRSPSPCILRLPDSTAGSLETKHTSPSPSSSPSSLPSPLTGAVTHPSQTTMDGSSDHLLAWFSSFVDIGPAGSTAPSDDELPSIKTDADFCELKETLYINHWRNSLLGVLPFLFEEFEDLAKHCSAVRPAIIALSACDLAQIRTDVRQWNVKGEKRWLFSPNAEHQKYGKAFYSIAQGELARLDYKEQEPTSLMATMMIFTLIESHIGSYRGASFHHHAIEHLLSDRRGFYDSSSLARYLVKTWMSLRALNWRYRIPYTMPDFQKSLSDLGLNIKQLHDSQVASDEAIMVIMLQSWHLSLMILFQHFTGGANAESTSLRCCRDFNSRIPLSGEQKPWIPEKPILDEDYEMLLAEQEAELSKWHASLPLDHLPHEYATDIVEDSIPNKFVFVDPTPYFASHQAAMNYIYYCTAQIFQSRWDISKVLGPDDDPFYHPDQGDDRLASECINRILQIMISLDITACAHHGTYSVGILEILHMCQLRLPEHGESIREGMGYIIAAYDGKSITHEGLHSIDSFRHAMREVEERFNNNKDFFYIMPRFSPDSQKQLAYDDSKPFVGYGKTTYGKYFFDFVHKDAEPPVEV